MSGLFDQVVNYSPPLLTSGQVNYDGTWNAATNTPTLVSPPDALSKGDYYVVSAAGTQFGISFAVGDWIISNGTAWEKVDLTDAVSSVFGRTGAVVGDSTDYSAVGLTNTAIGAANPSTGAFTSLSSSSTTTLNGTTIPASKTLVVTTDKLSALAATTSAELAGVISDETGSGSLVFANSPTLVSPALGTPSALVGTNITGTAAAFNINGTVGATTPSTVAATSVTALSNSGYQAVVGQLTSGDRVGISGQSSGSGTALVFFDNAQTTFRPAIFDASSHSLKISGVEKASVTSTGLQGAIGATTPSTGAFTSLSSTSGAFNGTVGATTRSTVAATTGNFQAGGGAPIILTGNSSAQIQLGGTGATDPSIRYDAAGVLGVVTADQSAYAKIRALDFNGTIGATTPSTGAFTTLSATGQATLSTTLLVGSGATLTGSGVEVQAANFQIIGRSSSTTRMMLAHDGTKGKIGTLDNQSFDFLVNNAIVGTVSSTGLNSTAIGATTPSTGAFTTLSASGDAGFATFSGNATVGLAASGALAKLHVLAADGNALRLARTGAGNVTITAVETGVAYRPLLLDAETVSARISGGTTVGTFSSTGLAVTGALSATTAGRFGTTSAVIHSTESLTAFASSGVTVGFACDAAASWPLSLWHKGTGTKDLAVFYSNDGGSFGLRGKIQTDGTGVSLISSSDERLKTNFRPITNSGAIIDALAPSLFDWLSGQKDTYGFGAQSTYQVFPQAVAKGDDSSTDITDQWGMDVSKLVPVLTAELQSLRARVAALESK